MSDYKFTKGNLTEAQLEEAIIELFQAEEYDYTDGNTLRRDYEEILLKDDLRDFIATRYANENLSETEMTKIMNRLEHINAAPLYIGNRAAFWLINEGFDLQRDDAHAVALHVDFIDFDEPENNHFRVVNQYSVQGSVCAAPTS